MTTVKKYINYAAMSFTFWEHIRLPGPGTQDPGPITRYSGPGSGETGPVTRDLGPMKQGT